MAEFGECHNGTVVTLVKFWEVTAISRARPQNKQGKVNDMKWAEY